MVEHVTAVGRIVDDLERAIDGDSWQGPSIREILDGVTPTDASSHPIAGAHSIWELVYHVTAWVRAVHERVLGNVCEPEGDNDWPPVRDTSDSAWVQAFVNLRAAQRELVRTLNALTDAEMSAAVPNREYDRAHMLHGLAHHHAYHAGQMALLKRACRQGANRP